MSKFKSFNKKYGKSKKSGRRSAKKIGRKSTKKSPSKKRSKRSPKKISKRSPITQMIPTKQIFITESIERAVLKYNPYAVIENPKLTERTAELNRMSCKKELDSKQIAMIEMMKQAGIPIDMIDGIEKCVMDLNLNEFKQLLLEKPVKLKLDTSTIIDGEEKQLYTIIDGRHRFARAIIEGLENINAIIV